MTTPAKIELWMVEAVKEMMVKHLGFSASGYTNWMLLESDLVASIAAHAPKETGIKPDNAEAAVPVSELQHIVDNVSALKDLRIKLQQLIHRYQPAGDDNEKV